MEIHDRIKGLRVKNAMTQKELAQALAVSVVSIQCWENGTKNPSMPAIIAIARKFGVTTDYLLGIEQNANADAALISAREQKLLCDYRSLDAYGRKAVDSICAIEKARITASISRAKPKGEIVRMPEKDSAPQRYIPRYSTPSAAGSSVPLGGEDFEMILADDSVPYDADFAVGIQGNSMLPYIHDGDTVYVKRDCDLTIGDVGIFCVDGSMYCKQYYVDDEMNLTLVSTNPRLQHTNVRITPESSSDVRCCGKVLMAQEIPLPDYFLNE